MNHSKDAFKVLVADIYVAVSQTLRDFKQSEGEHALASDMDLIREFDPKLHALIEASNKTIENGLSAVITYISDKIELPKKH